MTIGRATYEPGWKWSEHVGKALGKKAVTSPTSAWSSPAAQPPGVPSDRSSSEGWSAMDDSRIFEMKPGDIFYIEPGHDSWVIGNEPYVSIHMMGAADYAVHK